MCRADGEEDAEEIAWGLAATAFIGKRCDPARPGHFRPITTTQKVNNMWQCVLLEAANLHSEMLLNDSAFGFRPHRQTSDVACIVARLVVHARSTKEVLLIGKLDIIKAFDSTDLDVAEKAVTSFAGSAIARSMVGEHRRKIMELKISECSARHCPRTPYVFFQGSASLPGIFTWTMERWVLEPWRHIGAR